MRTLKNWFLHLSPMGRMLVVTFSVIGFLAFLKYRSIAKAIAEHSNFTPPPQAVTTADVSYSNWRPMLEVIGSLEPVQGVTVRAEEKGKVTKIGFESGALVKAGDLLIQLDTSVEEAELASARARAELGRINLRRAESLRAGRAAPEQSVNDATAAGKEANADVSRIQAVIAKKTVVAPFSGRTGIRMVNLGQYLAEGDSIVPLHSFDPIYVSFSVPQRFVSLLKIGENISIGIDTFPGENFNGIISAIDPQIDSSTRNIKVQATIPNPNERLRAGMFAKVIIATGEPKQVMIIPGSAVLHAPYGDSVYVVDAINSPDGKQYTGAKQQIVKLGESRGDLVEILSGLKEGEKVVSSGLFKLRPNIAVEVNNSIATGSDLLPNLPDT